MCKYVNTLFYNEEEEKKEPTNLDWSLSSKRQNLLLDSHLSFNNQLVRARWKTRQQLRTRHVILYLLTDVDSVGDFTNFFDSSEARSFKNTWLPDGFKRDVLSRRQLRHMVFMYSHSLKFAARFVSYVKRH